jgi:hypothetical protein
MTPTALEPAVTAPPTPAATRTAAGPPLPPRECDRFYLTAVKAIESSRRPLRLDVEAFRTTLVEPLRAGCADRVTGCHVPPPRDHVKVFVVTKSPRFDFDLSSEMGSLELELFENWYLCCSQLPATEDGSQSAFFDPKTALQIYANG